MRSLPLLSFLLHLAPALLLLLPLASSQLPPEEIQTMVDICSQNKPLYLRAETQDWTKCSEVLSTAATVCRPGLVNCRSPDNYTIAALCETDFHGR